ncbi:MAG TPA: hypothetical protein VKX45_07675 [Bryobacteraceae bacterium]|jgi:hypothetical protein|nr:hypothetical protein [Bryobacteraceae bacterium]
MTPTAEKDRLKRQANMAFTIVHPLDDAPEEKVDTEHLGPMRMTRTVRLCLFALRGYLLLMFGLLGFRVLQLAGIVRR